MISECEINNGTQSKLPVIIIGGGRHAKVLYDALQKAGRFVIGCTDNIKNTAATETGLKILGNDEAILQYNPVDVELVNSVAEFNLKPRRSELTKYFINKGYNFTSVVHPTAIVATNTILEPGVQVLSAALIQMGSRIGESTIINTGAIIDHDCEIGKNCHIAPGVILNGSVKIGDNTHIGSGTIIIEDISVGKNCTIAAGSVIYKNVCDNSTIIQKRQITPSV